MTKPTEKDRERARAWSASISDAESDDLSEVDKHAQGQADERARIVAALRRPDRPRHVARNSVLAAVADAIESGEL